MTIQEKLEKANIRHFDELIHDQPKEWLIENFGEGADKYPVNVAMLMRNIIWQTRERIITKEKPPLKELVRTFWYMYIKPVLSRAGALASETDQYKQLNSQLVFMVKDLEVMLYSDIQFRDENQAHRRVGANANIILFSEKLGHQEFLNEIAEKFRVSIIALGGQPSVINVEYFVDELKKAGINLQRSFYLYSVVDYDTSGWIIRDAFVDNLRFYGIKTIRLIDLVNPDALTQEEIMNSKFRMPAPASMNKKNNDWIKALSQMGYKNQQYLFDPGNPKELFGIESEAVSTKRLNKALEETMVPLIGKSEDLLKTYELRGLEKALKDLIIHKLAA
jgi:hypothetical protein